MFVQLIVYYTTWLPHACVWCCMVWMKTFHCPMYRTVCAGIFCIYWYSFLTLLLPRWISIPSDSIFLKLGRKIERMGKNRPEMKKFSFCAHSHDRNNGCVTKIKKEKKKSKWMREKIKKKKNCLEIRWSKTGTPNCLVWIFKLMCVCVYTYEGRSQWMIEREGELCAVYRIGLLYLFCMGRLKGLSLYLFCVFSFNFTFLTFKVIHSFVNFRM